MMHRRGSVSLLLAMALTGATMLLGGGAATAQPNMLQERGGMSATDVVNDVSVEQKLGAQVPLDLRFRDEAGKDVALRDYVHDKPVILVLAYYRCPMLCGEVLNGVVKALRPLSFDIGKEFDVVTVSIDPKETSELASEKKATYVDHYGREGAAAGWHFLTGEQEPIAALANTVGFRYVYDPQSNQYAHAGAIMVLTPEGTLSKYFYGVEYPTNDLRLALVEASEGKVGTAVDKLMLLCYMYDPVTGKYGLAIMRVLQAAGVLTIGGLGVFIVVTMRRDRRKKVSS